jgi:hypothetical protein
MVFVARIWRGGNIGWRDVTATGHHQGWQKTSGDERGQRTAGTPFQQRVMIVAEI